MPLLDHFHPPLSERRHWESFHATWAGAIADLLNKELLPENYFAEEQTQAGARVQIDVAAFQDRASETKPAQNGPVATLPTKVWTPPHPGLTMPAVFPGGFRVQVYNTEGGARLVAAIELVSPAN